MAVTPLANPPTPQNTNMDRAMFVWVPTVGGASDPMGSDANMQALLNFCGSNGVNVLFLDIWRYLGGGNWTAARQATMKKFVAVAHASGIRVMALAGDVGWGQNQQWVMTNILKPILQFNEMGEKVDTTYEGAWFDGVMLDVEYWATPGGYTATDPMGLCDLMNAARRILNIPVGCFGTQWLADPASAALSFTYKGVTQLEGLHLMDNADFVAVACYYNTSTQQIATFQNWFSYASQPGVGKNFGLWCGSETGTGLGNQSYWTGSAGAKATMETAHLAVSAAFVAAPNTNMSFRGQCIDAYASYSLMT